jgi:hypothetical protein
MSGGTPHWTLRLPGGRSRAIAYSSRTSFAA